jgi:hypothetical protein
MKLYDYPKEEIDAAIKLKKMSRTTLAVKVGRATDVVSRTINNKATIKSKSLEIAIVEELQPELNVIHQALINHRSDKKNIDFDQSPDQTQSRAGRDS